MDKDALMNLRSFTKALPALALIGALASSIPAHAFCGFYVAKADASLFNEASQVVLTRDEDRTVLTMVNDFQGEMSEFAVVIPVPTVLEREQINVGEMAVVDHLDAYTAPRLVEYHDPNPCELGRGIYELQDAPSVARMQKSAMGGSARAGDLGVKIEASYTVGEYDILILSAKQSDGLVTWLKQEGYRIPEGAEPVVGSYLKQGLKFFVAKVNLEEQGKLGYTKLRPLQMAFESKRFMLPIRLGTVNAKGKQDLIVYALTKKGRVETTNYRTVKLPSDMDVPLFVRDEFKDFYRSMFSRSVEKEDGRAVFMEYAWDMGWCDPCAADPLSRDELKKLGVFWLDEAEAPQPLGRPILPRGSPAQNVFVTRLHLRYDGEHFPADLRFQTTSDRSNFQGRYVLRNPATGDLSCEAGQDYLDGLRDRWNKDAERLASITEWKLGAIKEKIDYAWIDQRRDGQTPKRPKGPWWKRIWQ